MSDNENSVTSSIFNWPKGKGVSVSIGSKPGIKQWRLDQFKYLSDGNNITCMEFNNCGNLLAVGGKNGDISLFKRQPFSKSSGYSLYSHFASHTVEFDCLRSKEIDEKINKIRWLPQKQCPYFLLATNDKIIKLWKINECRKAYENDESVNDASVSRLHLPRIKRCPLLVRATESRIYRNAHEYNINSISLNSDQETYLSADDLRINIWHLDVTNSSFNVVDIKPKCLADLNEVITCAEFHPIECKLFAYSTSEGAIRLCDMRSSALCDQNSKEIKVNSSNEIDINPLGFIKMSPSGRYLMARDFVNLSIYDLRMENKILEQYSIQAFVRGRKRRVLYETEKIYDRFECCWSGNEDHIMTGSYNNFFKIFDRQAEEEVMLEARKDNIKPLSVLQPRQITWKLNLRPNEVHVDHINYDKKIQFMAWHPEEKTIAIGVENDLHIYKKDL